MPKIAITFPLLLALISCGSTPNKDGCTYDISKVPATVIAVLPSTDGESAEVLFEVSKKDGTVDTLYYSKQFGKPAYSDDMVSLDLHIGNALVCEHQIRKTGSCDPEVFVLKEEVYK